MTRHDVAALVADQRELLLTHANQTPKPPSEQLGLKAPPHASNQTA
jgi:hypothetical protein